MILNIPLLVFGILLLWFPRHWMRRGAALLRRRRRSAESARIIEPWREREPGDPRVSFKAEFRKLRNYLDLLRAGAAALVLYGGHSIAPSIAAAPDAPRAIVWQVIG